MSEAATTMPLVTTCNENTGKGNVGPGDAKKRQPNRKVAAAKAPIVPPTSYEVNIIPKPDQQAKLLGIESRADIPHLPTAEGEHTEAIQDFLKLHLEAIAIANQILIGAARAKRDPDSGHRKVIKFTPELPIPRTELFMGETQRGRSQANTRYTVILSAKELEVIQFCADVYKDAEAAPLDTPEWSLLSEDQRTKAKDAAKEKYKAADKALHESLHSLAIEKKLLFPGSEKSITMEYGRLLRKVYAIARFSSDRHTTKILESIKSPEYHQRLQERLQDCFPESTDPMLNLNGKRTADASSLHRESSVEAAPSSKKARTELSELLDFKETEKANKTLRSNQNEDGSASLGAAAHLFDSGGSLTRNEELETPTYGPLGELEMNEPLGELALHVEQEDPNRRTAGFNFFDFLDEAMFDGLDDHDHSELKEAVEQPELDAPGSPSRSLEIEMEEYRLEALSRGDLFAEVERFDDDKNHQSQLQEAKAVRNKTPCNCNDVSDINLDFQTSYTKDHSDLNDLPTAGTTPNALHKLFDEPEFASQIEGRESNGFNAFESSGNDFWTEPLDELAVFGDYVAINLDENFGIEDQWEPVSEAGNVSRPIVLQQFGDFDQRVQEEATKQPQLQETLHQRLTSCNDRHDSMTSERLVTTDHALTPAFPDTHSESQAHSSTKSQSQSESSATKDSSLEVKNSEFGWQETSLNVAGFCFMEDEMFNFQMPEFPEFESENLCTESKNINSNYE